MKRKRMILALLYNIGIFALAFFCAYALLLSNQNLFGLMKYLFWIPLLFLPLPVLIDFNSWFPAMSKCLRDYLCHLNPLKTRRSS